MNRRMPTPGGFTLIEIMLALGVLGVGMIMVAAVFPAAIYQTRAADRTTHSILICDNARAILQLKATHGRMDVLPDIDTAFVPVVIDDPAGEDPLDDIVIHADDAWYPSGPYLAEFNDRQGWVALARRYGSDDNDYQIVVIAYRKFDGMGYEVDGGNSVLDEHENQWNAGEAWCDGRNRPALVRISGDPWPGNLDSPTLNIGDVTITQSNGECFVFFPSLAGESPEDCALQFVSMGSPVILDGTPASTPGDWGRFPTIVEIEDRNADGDYFTDPRTGDRSIRCRLSGNIFARDDDDPRECSIWLMPGAGFRTPSPAIGAASFRTVLRD